MYPYRVFIETEIFTALTSSENPLNVREYMVDGGSRKIFHVPYRMHDSCELVLVLTTTPPIFINDTYVIDKTTEYVFNKMN